MGDVLNPYRTEETGRDFAVIGPNGHPVTTASHLDIAEGYAHRAGGLTVVRRILTVTYEPITERVAA